MQHSNTDFSNWEREGQKELNENIINITRNAPEQQDDPETKPVENPEITESRIPQNLHHSNLLVVSFDIKNFILYAPEHSFLKKFQDESQIQPPGIKGEEPVRLSEAFLRGYPGGLPSHF